jgi:hypothetical protein
LVVAEVAFVLFWVSVGFLRLVPPFEPGSHFGNIEGAAPFTPVQLQRQLAAMRSHLKHCGANPGEAAEGTPAHNQICTLHSISPVIAPT